MAIFVTSSTRDTETKDNLLTAGQNGLNIIRIIFYSLKSKIIHVLLGFGCPILSLCANKHIFVKQMSSDLAMLLAFLHETID